MLPPDSPHMFEVRLYIMSCASREDTNMLTPVFQKQCNGLLKCNGTHCTQKGKCK